MYQKANSLSFSSKYESSLVSKNGLICGRSSLKFDKNFRLRKNFELKTVKFISVCNNNSLCSYLQIQTNCSYLQIEYKFLLLTTAQEAIHRESVLNTTHL